MRKTLTSLVKESPLTGAGFTAIILTMILFFNHEAIQTWMAANSLSAIAVGATALVGLIYQLFVNMRLRSMVVKREYQHSITASILDAALDMSLQFPRDETNILGRLAAECRADPLNEDLRYELRLGVTALSTPQVFCVRQQLLPSGTAVWCVFVGTETAKPQALANLRQRGIKFDPEVERTVQLLTRPAEGQPEEEAQGLHAVPVRS